MSQAVGDNIGFPNVRGMAARSENSKAWDLKNRS